MESVMEKTTGWGPSRPQFIPVRRPGGTTPLPLPGGASGSGMVWWAPRGSIFRNVLAADWN
jgi:hypothetical protein